MNRPILFKLHSLQHLARIGLFALLVGLMMVLSQPLSILAASDPVIVAAGDIACDPTKSNFNGGNGTKNACHEKATADLIGSLNPNAVLPLGDTQYTAATLSQYSKSYNPTWGVFKNITFPIPGNHEYLTKNAADYYTYFGAAAHDPKKGYYSYNIGAWHLIAMNAECGNIGGCGSGSLEETWLKNDLAANTKPCILAYWHEPRFSSASAGNTGRVKVFWQDLYQAHADLVLNGHAHVYERFDLQSPSQKADAKGIREIVVGTGGDSHGSWSKIQPNSQARDNTAFGVLKLTLHSSSYSWQFVAEPGKNFTDSGTQACH